MNEFETKQAAYFRGFEARMQQLIDKEQEIWMEKQAFGIFRGLGSLAGGAARLGGAGLRGLGRAWEFGNRPIGSFGGMWRGLKGLGEEAAFRGGAQFRQGMGLPLNPRQTNYMMDVFNRQEAAAAQRAAQRAGAGAGGKITLPGVTGPMETATPRIPLAGSPALTASLAERLGPAGAGAAGAAAAPGAAAAMPGAAAAVPGAAEAAGAAVPAAAEAAGAAAPGAGRFGAGWLNRVIPPEMTKWINENPGVSQLAAGGIGAAGMGGYDAFKNWRRRKALRDAGFFQRLLLGGQMAFDPEGAIERMGL